MFHKLLIKGCIIAMFSQVIWHSFIKLYIHMNLLPKSYSGVYFLEIKSLIYECVSHGRSGNISGWRHVEQDMKG